ncbi:unnamed protein product [Prorocentrum cordatum]|uniref:Ceramide glucosyltransferase n=1 Tax=Prorocentrum cordatum TaxID=2364126 RepID=A0ABN9X2L4_9DINO|nr:unnamed protein product [Polarella glacialis]
MTSNGEKIVRMSLLQSQSATAKQVNSALPGRQWSVLGASAVFGAWVVFQCSPAPFSGAAVLLVFSTWAAIKVHMVANFCLGVPADSDSDSDSSSEGCSAASSLLYQGEPVNCLQRVFRSYYLFDQSTRAVVKAVDPDITYLFIQRGLKTLALYNGMLQLPQHVEYILHVDDDTVLPEDMVFDEKWFEDASVAEVTYPFFPREENLLTSCIGLIFRLNFHMSYQVALPRESAATRSGGCLGMGWGEVERAEEVFAPQRPRRRLAGAFPSPGSKLAAGAAWGLGRFRRLVGAPRLSDPRVQDAPTAERAVADFANVTSGTSLWAPGIVGLVRRSAFMKVFPDHVFLPFGEDAFLGTLLLANNWKIKRDMRSNVVTFAPPVFFTPCASSSREQGYGATSLFKQRAQRWMVTQLRRMTWTFLLLFTFRAGSLWSNIWFRIMTVQAPIATLISLLATPWAIVTALSHQGLLVWFPFVLRAWTVYYVGSVLQLLVINYCFWRHRPDYQIRWTTILFTPVVNTFISLCRPVGHALSVFYWIPFVPTRVHVFTHGSSSGEASQPMRRRRRSRRRRRKRRW